MSFLFGYFYKPTLFWVYLLPSRWVSRSTTAQRRKERLRQNAEHIGLDSDLREVGGLAAWATALQWS